MLHPQIRRLLVAVAALMVFWMTVRTVKFLLPAGHVVGRYCWYLYYLPMLFIPLCTTFLALLLGRSEDYRLPRRLRALAVPAAALVLFVLTNDLHGLVFVFPEGLPPSDAAYRYGVGFVLPALWGYGGLLATFALLFARSRLPHRGRRILAPIVPAALLLGYHVLYLLGLPWLRAAFGDMTITECLLIICILESCLRTGLIPSNARYAELFSAAELSAQIVDDDYIVRYASRDALPLAEETMRAAENGPVMLDEGRELRAMDLPGGHVLWTTDVSELLRLREKLADVHAELVEGNEALRHRFEEEQAHRRIVEQNRLYDVLQRETQSQINEIYALAEACESAADEKTRRALLARIILLGSFVKRRKDFVLSMGAAPLLPEGKLQSALEESCRALALTGVRGRCLVETGRESLPGALLTEAYDFFETFVELAPRALRRINITVRDVGGTLRIRILADCGGSFTPLLEKYPRARLERDEDGVTAELDLGGGEEA